MRFGSVFSGIEAASVAWSTLGWETAWVAEIDPFCNAVLDYRWPGVVNHGDVRKIGREQGGTIDILIGGPPCQSFSVAGKRVGLGDPRGQLSFEFLRVVQRLRPRWVVFENVPGLFSSRKGRDFGAWLGALEECGYFGAWRVLDAQYFGVAQRRRRVFVVAYLGDWRPAVAVLFDATSMSGVVAPSEGAQTQIETGPGGSVAGPGGPGRRIATPLTAKKTTDRGDPSTETYVVHSLRGEGFDASEDGAGRGVPLVAGGQPDVTGVVGGGSFPVVTDGKTTPTVTTRRADQTAVVFSHTGDGGDAGKVAPTLRSMSPGKSHTNAGSQLAVCFEPRFMRNGRGAPGRVAPPLKAQSGRSGKGDGAPLVMLTTGTRGMSIDQAAAGMLVVDGEGPQVFQDRLRGDDGRGYERTQHVANKPSLGAMKPHRVFAGGHGVRRLTPRECERLQGFRDDYTLIPNWRYRLDESEVEQMAAYLRMPLDEARELGATADGPRYHALGNSMAVPVILWLGERIELVERAMRDCGVAM